MSYLRLIHSSRMHVVNTKLHRSLSWLSITANGTGKWNHIKSCSAHSGYTAQASQGGVGSSVNNVPARFHASSHSNQVPRLDAPATNHHQPPSRNTYPAYLQLIRCLWQTTRGQGRSPPSAETALGSASTVARPLVLYYLVLACKDTRCSQT